MIRFVENSEIEVLEIMQDRKQVGYISPRRFELFLPELDQMDMFDWLLLCLKMQEVRAYGYKVPRCSVCNGTPNFSQMVENSTCRDEFHDVFRKKTPA